MQDFLFDPRDLAPGDSRSMTVDFSRFDVHRVASEEDPLFEQAYRFLWQYFGPSNELESAEILAHRLARESGETSEGTVMRYELMLVRDGDALVAACDQTAVADAGEVVVHVSHVLIAPSYRRSGLGGWMRAFPIQTARRCLSDGGLPADLPITLVAEMEYPDGLEERRFIRLKAYERAGFLKIDPSVIAYQQPDFRAPELIDATGGPEPLPFQLIIRRIGHEGFGCISGAEVRTIVERLYKVYARDFRPADMVPLWRQLEHYPSAATQIRLIPPTE